MKRLRNPFAARAIEAVCGARTSPAEPAWARFIVEHVRRAAESESARA
jgi:hypothetical protein